MEDKATLVVHLNPPKELEHVEKVNDLVDECIRRTGPLIQSKKPLQEEVKEGTDQVRVILGSVGHRLPVYTEEWDQYDLDNEEAGMPLEEAGFYHASATGLCSKRIPPLFLLPIGIVANSRRFDVKGGSLVGSHPILSVKKPGRDLMTKNAALAVESEAILRAFSKLETDDSGRKLYFRNYKVLRFYAATWDALMLSYQLVRTTSTSAEFRGYGITWNVNADLRRQIERFRVQLLMDPYKSAKKLKELAGHARAWFFGAKKPNQPLLRSIPSKYYALIFSYLGRALPPHAMSDIAAGYDSLVKRLTSEPPPEVPAWRPFIQEYLRRYRPKEIDNISYPTDCSAGAALGYSRQQGGFAAATQDLVGLGLALMKSEPRPTDVIFNPDGSCLDLTSIYYSTAEHCFTGLGQSGRAGYYYDPRIELSRLNKLAALQQIYSLALNRAVEWTFERIDMIPFVALSAPEAGLKTRYPTLAPCAVLHVSQILRRAADSHLLRDPRNREGLGGKPEIRLDRWSGPWYSQDLTSATDLHPFWLQRVFYEEILELHPRLRVFAKHLPKLFGPRRLISPDDYKDARKDDLKDPPPNPYADLLRLDWEKARPNIMTPSYFYNSVDRDEFAPRWDEEDEIFADLTPFFETSGPAFDMAVSHIEDWEEWWRTVNALPGITTSTGDPMGEAASFPLMDLVTNFSGERAGLPKHGNTGDDSRIPLGQKALPRILSEPPDSRTSKMNEILKSLSPNYKEWGPMDRLKIHEQSLSELGAVLSRGDPKEGKPNKIFIHPVYSLYKEIPMRGDHKLPFIPTKLLSAPPGGSKGSISWFNQPTAVRQHCVDFQFHIPHRLWKKLPYWNETQAAFSYGVPVREAVMLGGVNHPCFPHTAGLNPHNTQRWLSCLSSLTLIDWATGTGLSPLPSGTPQQVRHASKEWLRNLVREEKSSIDENVPPDERRFTRLGFDPNLRGPLPSLKEAAEEATRFASSYLLYGVGPVEFLRTPSIMTVSHKFHRRLSKGKLYLRKRKEGGLAPLTYHGTMQDISKKTNIFLLDPDVHIPGRHAARGYGLLESKFDPDRKPWRWDWLERSSSDETFISMFAEAVVGSNQPT